MNKTQEAQAEVSAFVRRYAVRNGVRIDSKRPVRSVVCHAVARFGRMDSLRAWVQSPTLSPRAQALLWREVKL